MAAHTHTQGLSANRLPLILFFAQFAPKGGTGGKPPSAGVGCFRPFENNRRGAAAAPLAVASLVTPPLSLMGETLQCF